MFLRSKLLEYKTIALISLIDFFSNPKNLITELDNLIVEELIQIYKDKENINLQVK